MESFPIGQFNVSRQAVNAHAADRFQRNKIHLHCWHLNEFEIKILFNYISVQMSLS